MRFGLLEDGVEATEVLRERMVSREATASLLSLGKGTQGDVLFCAVLGMLLGSLLGAVFLSVKSSLTLINNMDSCKPHISVTNAPIIFCAVDAAFRAVQQQVAIPGWLR